MQPFDQVRVDDLGLLDRLILLFDEETLEVPDGFTDSFWWSSDGFVKTESAIEIGTQLITLQSWMSEPPLPDDYVVFDGSGVDAIDPSGVANLMGHSIVRLGSNIRAWSSQGSYSECRPLKLPPGERFHVRGLLRNNTGGRPMEDVVNELLDLELDDYSHVGQLELWTFDFWPAD